MIKDLLCTDKMGFCGWGMAGAWYPRRVKKQMKFPLKGIESFDLIKTNPKAIRQTSGKRWSSTNTACHCDLEKTECDAPAWYVLCTADVCYGIIGAFLSSRLKRLWYGHEKPLAQLAHQANLVGVWNERRMGGNKKRCTTVEWKESSLMPGMFNRHD